MPMFTDPCTVERTRYECAVCGERVVSEDHPVECEACGGSVRNISVPRD